MRRRIRRRHTCSPRQAWARTPSVGVLPHTGAARVVRLKLLGVEDVHALLPVPLAYGPLTQRTRVAGLDATQAGLTVPASQVSHCDWSADANWPDAHSAHPEEPEADTLPSLHEEHTPRPFAPVKVPVAQGTHALADMELAVGQRPHSAVLASDADSSLYVQGAQSEHSDESPEENVPAEHATHAGTSDAPESPSDVHAEQGEHTASPPTE